MSNRLPPLIIPTLDPTNPDHLEHFSPEPDGGINKARLVGIDQRPFPDEIDLARRDEFCALKHLPYDVEARDDELHRVVGPEARCGPGLEGGVAVEDCDDGHPHEREPGAVGLEVAKV